MNTVKVRFKDNFAGSTDGINIERYEKGEVAEVSAAFFNLYGDKFIVIGGPEDKKVIIDDNQITIDDLTIEEIKDVDDNGNPIDRTIWLNGNNDVVFVEDDSDKIVYEADWLRTNKTIQELKLICRDLNIKVKRKNEDNMIDAILKAKGV